MTLHDGSLLKRGEYKILKVLGQGGFGITYLGEQTGLGRKVAIKEFFMKELCERDETTSHVSVPSSGSREMVAKFREKFIKEARLIASFDNSHIVRIHDIFEENGTAYYVMENLDGGSLSDMLEQQGRLPESEALSLIRQVGDALSYIHSQNVLHLDVKPSNILLRKNSDAVLIDFGISKRYDESGSQTSSTPAGLSKGYAPLEQYNQGLQNFSPATDVYSLGATLFRMLTGDVPPEASIVNEEGLPSKPSFVSASVWAAIDKAMQPRRKDRPQTVKAWLDMLGASSAKVSEATGLPDEKTVLHQPEPNPIVVSPEPKPAPAHLPSKSNKPIIFGIIAAAVVALGIVLFKGFGGGEDPVPPSPIHAPVAEEIVEPEPEAAGFDVSFSCNVPSATLYVDGKANGSASESHFLKSGSHAIKVTAEGYKDYTREITVNSQTQPVKIQMTENPKPVVAETPVPTDNSTIGTHRGHNWVDLGLSVKWATTNVGATNPGDYGSYYAWGETRTKTKYTWSNCFDCLDSSGDSWGTYKQEGQKEITPNGGHDAARENWGGNWRLPTEKEIVELSKCSWKWTKQDGHNGFVVTGPNGNSIFLPAAGYRDDKGSTAGYWGGLWTNSILPYSSGHGTSLNFNEKGCLVNGNLRKCGMSVRPVLGSN